MCDTSSADTSSVDGDEADVEKEGDEISCDSEGDSRQPTQATFVDIISTPTSHHVGVVSDPTSSSVKRQDTEPTVVTQWRSRGANWVSEAEPTDEILGTVRVVNVDGYGAATVSTGAPLEAVLAEAAMQGYDVVHHYHDHDDTNSGP